MSGDASAMMTPAIPPPALLIMEAAARVRSVLMELPRTSPGPARAIAKIDAALQGAGQLLRARSVQGDRVGDFAAGLNVVLADLRDGYRLAKRTAHALITVPYVSIVETYRVFRDWSMLPEVAIRELGGRLGTAIDHGLQVLDANAPLLANLARQAYAGIGVGVLVVVLAGMFLLFPRK